MPKQQLDINRDLFKQVLTLIDENWSSGELDLIIEKFDLNKDP
jgi:hypothetical protein